MKTVQERIEASREYLGSGTYECLIPVITDHGKSSGWAYFYPLGIQLHGQRYADLGYTLDSLEEAGIIKLMMAKCTCI